MIGFSIMMWFVGIVLLITSISLLKGNTSSVHGKVFENTVDKVGYGKAMGKVVLFIALGISCCSSVALIDNVTIGGLCLIIGLVIVILISSLSFHNIQKKYEHDKTPQG